MPRSDPAPGGLLGQALICINRDLDGDLRQEHYAGRLHDEKVGWLAPGSFLYHLTAPGRRIIFVDAEVSVSRSIRLRSDEVHYIRVDHRIGSILSHPKLLPVEPDEGVRELSKLSYSGPELTHIARQYCLPKLPRRP